MTGIELIAQERQEQIEKHGYSIGIDAIANEDCELAMAARVLIGNPYGFHEDDLEMMPTGWNENDFRKMLLKNYPQRLIIAGALIAAEIDRLNT